MYSNLKAEMIRKGMNVQELSEIIDIGMATLYAKLRGERSFSLEETLKIKDALGVDMTIEELFVTK